MTFYKVTFDDNVATIAERLPGFQSTEVVQTSERYGKSYVEWLVVTADNEVDAISEATNILHRYILPPNS